MKKRFAYMSGLLFVIALAIFLVSGCDALDDEDVDATWDTNNSVVHIGTYSWNSNIDHGRFIANNDGSFWMENLAYTWPSSITGKYIYVLSFNESSMRISSVQPGYYYPDETGRSILVESNTINPAEMAYYYNFFFYNDNNSYYTSFSSTENLTNERRDELLDICAEAWEANNEDLELYVLGENDSYLVLNDFEDTSRDSCEIGFLNHVGDEFKLADTFYAPSGFQPELLFNCDYDQDDKSDFAILKIMNGDFYYYRVYNSGLYERWHWVYELQQY